MSKPTFNLSVSVDEDTGRMMAVYVQIRKASVSETREVAPGKAFADYDADGNLLGVELIGPCEINVLDGITEKEPDQVKRFLRGATPRDMVAAG